MKTKIKFAPGHGKTAVATETIRLWTQPVHYTWSTPDGTRHHTSDTVVAPTRARLKEALRKFWISNPQVEAK